MMMISSAPCIPPGSVMALFCSALLCLSLRIESLLVGCLTSLLSIVQWVRAFAILGLFFFFFPSPTLLLPHTATAICTFAQLALHHRIIHHPVAHTSEIHQEGD